MFGAFFTRDLIPIVAALEYNQWFTKLSSKDLKLVSIRVNGDYLFEHFCNFVCIKLMIMG